MTNINDVLMDVQKNKKIAEGRIIGAFVNKLDLISDYDVNASKWSESSKFYYNILKEIQSNGYKDVDKVTVMAYLKDYPDLMSKFNEYGGYVVLSDLARASSVNNIDGAFQDLEKYILIEELHSRNFRIEDIYDEILKPMKSTKDITAFYEYQLDDASLEVSYSDIEFQSFEVTDADLQEFKEGAMIGIRYNNICPLLDYHTLGFPIGDLTIVGSYINQGKTSFMAHVGYGMASKGQKVGIIANEQNLNAYKQLLIMHVLAVDLKYFNLDRKTLKMGAWNDHDEQMLRQAQQIIRDVYVPNLSFLEVYDYDTSIVSRAVRRWANMGFHVAIYDTLKADFNSADGWISLINSTRNLYQLAHSQNMAIIGVMQLRMAEKNTRRVLDMDVLANGRQASETASEVVFFRALMADEMPGEKNEAKVFEYVKDENGKFTEIKREVQLPADVSHSEYRVFFICKTRNDQVGTAVLYRFHGDFNVWEEIGYVDIVPNSIAS